MEYTFLTLQSAGGILPHWLEHFLCRFRSAVSSSMHCLFKMGEKRSDKSMEIIAPFRSMQLLAGTWNRVVTPQWKAIESRRPAASDNVPVSKMNKSTRMDPYRFAYDISLMYHVRFDPESCTRSTRYAVFVLPRASMAIDESNLSRILRSWTSKTTNEISNSRRVDHLRVGAVGTKYRSSKQRPMVRRKGS